jgi:hypothetical protein
MRQIICSSAASMSATSSRKESSNIDWERRSYHMRCIGAWLSSVAASPSPASRASASAAVAWVAIAS